MQVSSDRSRVSAIAVVALLALLVVWFIAELVATGRSGALANLVGLPRMAPLFADSDAILAALRCQELGVDVYLPSPCDVIARPHVYGSLWLALGYLGGAKWNLVATGIVCNGLFVIALGMVLRHTLPANRLWIGLTFLLCISPAVMLGMERGNNDLVIFALLAAAGFALLRDSRTAFVAGVALVGLCAVLKFYPIVLLAIPLLLPTRRLEWRGWTAFALFAVIIALAVAIDVRKVPDLPQPHGPWAFGGQLILWRLMPIEVARFCALAAAGTIAAFHFWRALIREPAQTAPGVIGAREMFFTIGTVVLLSNFAATSGFFYRWIFFLMSAPYLCQRMTEPAGRPSLRLGTAQIALASGALMMWAMAWEATLPEIVGAIHGGAEPWLRPFIGVKELLGWVCFCAMSIELIALIARHSPLFASLQTRIGREPA